MSGVLRPTGPRSARIYWRRRVVLVLLAVLLLSSLWWLASGRSDAGPSSRQAGQPSGQRHQPATPEHHHVHPPGPVAQHTAGPGKGSTPTNAGRPTGSGERLPAPSGRCPASDVALRVRAAGAESGHSMPITLVFRGLTVPACTLDVAPATVELRVVSSDSVVWATTDCPDAFPARQVVVRAGLRSHYAYDWNGRASVLGCHGVGSVAKPGQYWVEAALIGADPVRAPITVAPAG